MRRGLCGVLGEPLDTELLGDAGGGWGCLGRFLSVRGRFPAVVRRDVVAVVVVVVVRRVLGRATEHAREILLLTPVARETLLALIAVAIRSGEDVPVPAGEIPGAASSTADKDQSSAMGMEIGEDVILGVERLRRLSWSLFGSSSCLLLSLSRRST